MSELPQTMQQAAQRIRRRWFFAAAIGLFVLLVVFHAPLLRGVGNFLVVDEPQTGGDLLILSNDVDRIAPAALLYRQGNYDRVLLLRDRMRRNEAAHVGTSSIEEAKAELAARGVSEDRIVVVGADSSGLTERVREACNVARSQADRRTTLITSAFEGAAVQRLVRRELQDDAALKLALASSDPMHFDRRHWWTSRIGTQAVFRGYFTWLLVACRGDEAFADRMIDWKAYEAAVARGEKP